jgi:hypothetical protein
MKLGFIQASWGAWMWDGLQTVRPATRHGAPAVERPAINAENFSDLSMRLTAVHQLNRMDTPPL